MLHILHKHLANERAWLRYQSLAQADRKYAEGARMAKERIPQLEAVIKMILDRDKPQEPIKKVGSKQVAVSSNNQLNLFQP